MAKPYVASNMVENEIAVGNTWTRGTDTSIVLTDGTDFDSGGGYIRIGTSTSYALMEYTGKTSNTLTGLTPCTLGVVVTSGDETKEWPAGTIVARQAVGEELEDRDTLLSKTDFPSAYTDKAGMAAVVNSGENAIEFLRRLSVPTGTGWANRTYAGWEICDTAATYEIGVGKDYETLAAAAAALEGLILTADIKLQLTANIDLTSNVTFKGMVSAGGRLDLDLNGFGITIGDGCTFGIIANGPFEFIVRTTNGASTIGWSATSFNPPYYMVNGQSGCLLDLSGATSGNTLTLDNNSKAATALIRIYKSRGRFYRVAYSNLTNLTMGAVYATATSHGGFTDTDPASLKADRGSILIKTDGTVVTS
jgi:hypothetical protein